MLTIAIHLKHWIIHTYLHRKTREYSKNEQKNNRKKKQTKRKREEEIKNGLGSRTCCTGANLIIMNDCHTLHISKPDDSFGFSSHWWFNFYFNLNSFFFSPFFTIGNLKSLKQRMEKKNEEEKNRKLCCMPQIFSFFPFFFLFSSFNSLHLWSAWWKKKVAYGLVIVVGLLHFVLSLLLLNSVKC